MSSTANIVVKKRTSIAQRFFLLVAILLLTVALVGGVYYMGKHGGYQRSQPLRDKVASWDGILDQSLLFDSAQPTTDQDAMLGDTAIQSVFALSVAALDLSQNSDSQAQETTRKAIGSLEEQLDTAVGQVQSLTAQNTQFEGERAALSDQLKRLENHANTRQADYSVEAAMLKDELSALKEQIKNEQAQRVSTRQALEQVTEQAVIDRKAYEALTTTLTMSDQEIQRLKKELGFYRNIFSSDDDKAGLQINDFSVSAVDDNGNWRYSLVIVQTSKKEKTVSGTLSIEIEGTEGRLQKIVNATSFGAQYSEKIKFKYLHRVRGSVSLPVEFQPIRIGVSFAPKGRDAQLLTQWYDWPKA